MRLKLEKGASVESVTPHLSITSVSIQQLKSQMENLKLLIGLGDIVPAPVDLSVVADSTFRKLSALAVEREIRLESIGHSGGSWPMATGRISKSRSPTWCRTRSPSRRPAGRSPSRQRCWKASPL
ncbi:MAG: hypothetical protein IPK19_25925 [Chloroflexi bacterium]|nr:hypothetical protein [Chloroflexota bacterium]